MQTRARHCRRQAEHRRRRPGIGASAGRNRWPAGRQGLAALAAGRRTLRAHHPMHRRRHGYRNGSGGGMNTTDISSTAVGVEASNIRLAAVIGAGSMGAGIAAQFANAGVPVILLDIAGDGSSRNAPAEAGIARQLKTGGFMHPDAANLVQAGNIDDDLHRLADADWIVEAVIERLDIKRDLYRKIATVRKAGAVVSSNTSTIPLAELVEGLDHDFAAHFLITHFFNPPRIMQLVEIVASPANAPEIVAHVKNACE